MRKKYLIVVILAVGFLVSCQTGIETGFPNQNTSQSTTASETNVQSRIDHADAETTLRN